MSMIVIPLLVPLILFATAYNESLFFEKLIFNGSWFFEKLILKQTWVKPYTILPNCIIPIARIGLDVGWNKRKSR